ncbi:unnamed protein product, partial [Medioppia subpectinata]
MTLTPAYVMIKEPSNETMSATEECRRLAEPFVVTGEVVHGFGRGSKELGIPTANVDPEVVKAIGTQLESGIYYGFCQLVPTTTATAPQVSNGVVDTTAAHESRPPVYGMVCSLGWNPQYNNTIRSLEAYILHKFDTDFYGSTLRVAIC